MIALKAFENKEFGKILKGQVIPNRVLNKMDITGLKKAGFIAEPKKETKKESKK